MSDNKIEWRCDVCQNTFKGKKNLILHQRIHTGEKPFPCSFCEKSFPRKSYLKDHILSSHAEQKPHCCEKCGKAYVRKVNYDIHMSTHHSGKKPYHCRECGKSFPHRTKLLVHMKNHTSRKSIPCIVCSRSFTRRYNLIKHMRSHTGEKPHSCTICERSFTEKNTLIRHMRTHTGERPFECRICKKGFIRADHLRKHSYQCPMDTNAELVEGGLEKDLNEYLDVKIKEEVLSDDEHSPSEEKTSELCEQNEITDDNKDESQLFDKDRVVIKQEKITCPKDDQEMLVWTGIVGEASAVEEV